MEPSVGKRSVSKIAGWILSALLSALLIFASAGGKFTEWEGKAEMFDHIGYSSDVIFRIGIVEVVIAILYLIPQSAFFGAILLTGYLGGATATHVRVGDAFVMPIIMGILAWVFLGLRDPRIFTLAFRSGIRDATR